MAPQAFGPNRAILACLACCLAWGCGSGNEPAADDAQAPGDAASVDAASPAEQDAGLDLGGPDGGTSDSGASLCVARPTPDDDNELAHFTHPTLFGATGPLTVEVDSTLDNPEWPGHPVTLYRPANAAAYPVLFYSHAFGGTDPQHVEELFKRLASNGYNVVFVPYQQNDRLKQYAQLWVGFRTAVTNYGAKFDMTRVGFVGHSFGGGATPEMARRAFGAPVENGLAAAWGSAGRMMFIMAPWYSYPNLANPTALNNDFHQLPDDVRTVIQLYADDDINDHQISVHDIWDKLPATLVDKGFLLVKSDACGASALNASHSTPATYGTGGPGTGNNDHDEWATARRIHALAAYAFEGSTAAKALAYPATEAELSLGNWVGMCNGRPVVPLEASRTGLVLTGCGGKASGDYTFTYSLAGHCQNSATGIAGTPPCR